MSQDILYRAYILDRSGKVADALDILAAHDNDAKDKARRLHPRHDVELRRNGLKIGMVRAVT